MMILLWIPLILLVIWLVPEFSGRKNESPSKALDTLKERYARGEITKKEFETMKKDIM